jgi:hypothetical protein
MNADNLDRSCHHQRTPPRAAELITPKAFHNTRARFVFGETGEPMVGWCVRERGREFKL